MGPRAGGVLAFRIGLVLSAVLRELLAAGWAGTFCFRAHDHTSLLPGLRLVPHTRILQHSGMAMQMSRSEVVWRA
jgi:predicted TIM-barrel fold metal-dependent hydrolase